MSFSLQIEYNNICRKYAQLFCKKHDLVYNDDNWVSGEFGSILEVDDYYFNFNDMKYDIDHEIEDKEEIFNYNQYCIDAAEFNIPIPNYKSWCMGCPRTSNEKFEQLRDLRKKMDELVKQSSYDNQY